MNKNLLLLRDQLVSFPPFPPVVINDRVMLILLMDSCVNVSIERCETHYYGKRVKNAPHLCEIVQNFSILTSAPNIPLSLVDWFRFAPRLWEIEQTFLPFEFGPKLHVLPC